MGDLQGTGPHRAGWYADPAGSPLLRWWDGDAWTDHLAPASGPGAPLPPRQRSSGRTALLVIAIVLGSLAAAAAGLVLLLGACIALLGGLG